MGCAVEDFPWIITGLVAIVAVLVLLRAGLYARELWLARKAKPTGSSQPANPASTPGTGSKKPGTGQPGAPTPAAPSTPPPAPAPVSQPKPPPKPTPLQLRVVDAPDLRLSHFRGDLDVQNDFCDLLSGVLLASQGWKKLQSKFFGNRGIDGLFVREVRGGGGYECLAIESRANGSPYDPATMADTKIAADIVQLYELGALPKPMADELLRGLDQGPSFFRKELWRHDLSGGLSTISELGRKGEKGRSVTRSHARLISALFLSLEHFDRGSVYLGQQPVDDPGDTT
jgi:hypothetical protein